MWDDHDFGINNGNAFYHKKYITREIYLDFIKEPQDSVRRLEKHRGLQQDYVINHKGIKVHVILLDVRFHYE